MNDSPTSWVDIDTAGRPRVDDSANLRNPRLAGVRFRESVVKVTLLSDAGEDTAAAEAAGPDDTELPVEVTAALNQGGSADGKMEDPEMQRLHLQFTII